MRPDLLRRSKALSPYAQALKHVALRGALGLGPGAKAAEWTMARRGVLPADYRPPAQGKWDDTIERWAYAWQYPAEEVFEDPLGALQANSEGMRRLVSFAERLLASPPSALPGSGRSSAIYRIPSGIDTIPHLTLPETSYNYAMLEASVEAAADTDSNAKAMISSEEFSRETNIPIAYLDDQSEKSNAGKELLLLLEDCGLEYTEDGLITVISALACQHYYDAALAMFNFASQVGLGPSAEHYKALMKYPAAHGDVNQSMALIEEMKKSGITPRIGNWHELIRSFHNAKDYPAVSQIVDNMKMYANIEPNEVTFLLQLRAFSKDASQSNSLAESIQLFDQMENVYGYIASRPHYDALMFSLSQSPIPEMRLRCEELAKKMDLMGISWNAMTYLNLIRSSQVVGDVDAVEKYLGKMREDCIPLSILHLSWSIQAHVQYIIRLDYETLKEKKTDIRSIWLERMSTCFGIYEIVVERGWGMQLPFLNAMLRLCCQTTILCMEHFSSDTLHIGKFEDQANKIWNNTFDEWGLKKDVYSYECYIALLTHQQRIDEAEKLFQQMVLQEDLTPSRRTYECLIFMHLSSGEEGGAARALHYLEALERSKIRIRPSLLRKIVQVNNAAGYKRDMKRRARRIIQAREEYFAKKKKASRTNPISRWGRKRSRRRRRLIKMEIQLYAHYPSRRTPPWRGGKNGNAKPSASTSSLRMKIPMGPRKGSPSRRRTRRWPSWAFIPRLKRSRRFPPCGGTVCFRKFANKKVR
ncbi:unnamed protein product [Phytomonas sp. Hart1]|nr:unnamed protein product [Phytomonas sp. Hart1]|eukprot:CCW66358.1 unnamed protein product [Phytomonas sp. isolate Hart1]